MRRINLRRHQKILQLLRYRHRKKRNKQYHLKYRSRKFHSLQKIAYAPHVSRPTKKTKIPQSIILPTKVRKLSRRVIIAPEKFSFRSNYEEVASFVQYLRYCLYDKYFRSRNTTIAIDFTSIKHISMSAALVLAAELDRWQKVAKTKLTPKDADVWRPEVVRMFMQMGLFELLEMDVPKSVDEHKIKSEITTIKYLRNQNVNVQSCALLVDYLVKVSGSMEAKNFIYDGLMEALKNALHHAYPSDKNFGVETGTWWMCGSYNNSMKRFTASVFDCGVGIPATLPASGYWEAIQKRIADMGINNDANKIAAAMKYGRSRLAIGARGNGLPTMTRLIDAREGELRIISGFGELRYLGNNDMKTYPHDVDLGGTLIEWRIDGRKSV